MAIDQNMTPPHSSSETISQDRDLRKVACASQTYCHSNARKERDATHV